MQFESKTAIVTGGGRDIGRVISQKLAAEGANENDKPQEAIDALNMGRNRESVQTPEYLTADYPVGNKQQIFEVIVHERRVELGFELNRYNDLRRWGIASDVLGDLGYTSKYRYFPILQGELDVNPELVQNEDFQ